MAGLVALLDGPSFDVEGTLRRVLKRQRQPRFMKRLLVSGISDSRASIADTSSADSEVTSNLTEANNSLCKRHNYDYYDNCI